MSPAELREGVAREICRIFRWDWGGLDDAGKAECLAFSDAALAVVREAMREPDAGMLKACLERDGSDDDLYVSIWRAQFAASPLRDAP